MTVGRAGDDPNKERPGNPKIYRGAIAFRRSVESHWYKL